ncbi:hypothetical protein CQW23_03914 [Capsicum baccatum]|uniref:RNase H type-1 domain-containing protein n=1 Tax=Capsicum baccatum TaxID=33114 RepID=A0A2G2XD60_CAPBA|nr:hypothetical protein CQW23_03914 [Capsicum baccatum]
MQDHLVFLNDFLFNRVIEVPAIGNAEGLTVLWDNSILELGDVATIEQEIHAIVKHDRLSTKYYLHHIGIDTDPLCFSCHLPETTKHIFLECKHVKKFWDKNSLSELYTNSTVASTSKHCLSWKNVFPFFLWCIWLNSNTNIFNKTNLDIPNIAYERAVEYHFLASKGKSTRKMVVPSTIWTPPMSGIALNVDGSFNLTQGGVEFVFRNNEGCWIVGFSASINVQSSFEAETTALIIGIKMALQMRLSQLTVATDSKKLATLLFDSSASDCSMMNLTSLLFAGIY